MMKDKFKVVKNSRKEENMSNEITLFEDGKIKIEVKVSPEKDTVWLSQKQMSELFDVSTDNISLHINNILKEKELDNSTVEESSVVQQEGKRSVKRNIKMYNLDMIISVGYRVKSKRGIAFRKWANNILKQYILEGYAINQNRITQLGEVIRIMKRTEQSLDSKHLKVKRFILR